MTPVFLQYCTFLLLNRAVLSVKRFRKKMLNNCGIFTDLFDWFTCYYRQKCLVLENFFPFSHASLMDILYKYIFKQIIVKSYYSKVLPKILALLNLIFFCFQNLSTLIEIYKKRLFFSFTRYFFMRYFSKGQ